MAIEITTACTNTAPNSNDLEDDDQQQEQALVVIPPEKLVADVAVAAVVVPGAQSIQHGDSTPVDRKKQKKGGLVVANSSEGRCSSYNSGGGAVVIQEADCTAEVLVASATYATCATASVAQASSIASAASVAVIPVATATATAEVVDAKFCRSLFPPSRMSYYYTESSEEWQQEHLLQPIGHHQFNSCLQSIPEDSEYLEEEENETRSVVSIISSTISDGEPPIVDVSSCPCDDHQSCWEL